MEVSMLCQLVLPPPSQVFICHDLDTGRELAVKVVDIDHIDHSTPSSEATHMQKVRHTLHVSRGLVWGREYWSGGERVQ